MIWQRARYGTEKGTIPGGKVERGESWRMAGAREVEEETGFEIWE